MPRQFWTAFILGLSINFTHVILENICFSVRNITQCFKCPQSRESLALENRQFISGKRGEDVGRDVTRNKSH